MSPAMLPARHARLGRAEFASQRRERRYRSWVRRIGSGLFPVAAVAVSAVVASLVQPYAQLADLAMIHLLGIVLVSIRASVRASVGTAILSILVFDYLFIPPRFMFAWTDAKSSLTFAAMLIVAVVISGLNRRLVHQELLARQSAFRAQALYELNEELADITDVRQLAHCGARHLERLFDARAMVLLSGPEQRLDARAGTVVDEERELARRAWDTRAPVEARLPSGAHEIWIPLRAAHDCIGVLGLASPAPPASKTDAGLLLTASAAHLASAIERAQLAQAAHRAEVDAEGERLRSSLLSAVSHDLKTPLATILAASTTLLSGLEHLAPADARELVSSIVGESERLNRLIHNLLSVTRLEAPTVELRRMPESVDELVSSAVEHVGGGVQPGRFELDMAADLPLVAVEPALVEQVLTNLFENALRYAGSGSPISVTASTDGDFVTVSVADRGPGFDPEETDKVFEKFYRGRNVDRRDGGVGLGLTICRAIVRAHGGRIAVRSRAGGGGLVEFNLPVADVGPALDVSEGEPRP